MSAGFQVQAGALPSIAGSLRTVSENLEALGSSVPRGIDGGAASADISNILAHLVGQAAELVAGAQAAADLIDTTESNYADADASAITDVAGAGSDLPGAGGR